MMAHVEDGALVRHLDGEAVPEERAAVSSHLDACEQCAARLAALGRAAEALTAALRAADAPSPRAPARPRWGFRAAAAVLVLAGVAGAVRPVRAWFVDRAQALWETVSGRDAPAPVPAAPAVPRSASVAFVPEGTEFALEVTGGQAGGVLRVETGVGDTALAVVRNGTGLEDLVVLPNALRIVSHSASTASYLVRVPPRLTRVVVRVGEDPPWDYRPGEPPREIDLGSR